MISIPGVVFFSTFCCFLLFLYNNYIPKEPRKSKPQRQPKPTKPLYVNGELKTAEAATKQPPRQNWKTPERIQQETEYEFYNNRLHTLETMLTAAAAAENKATDKLLTSYDLNQYGSVISEKVIKRAESELYTAQQKRLRIENQLQQARRGRHKALETMTRAGG